MNSTLKALIFTILLLFAAVVQFVVILLCVLLSIPEYPPYKHELCTDPTEYMSVNAYVEERLQTRHTNFFPDEIEPDENTVYFYDYSFNDRELHLALYLEQSFKTDDAYKGEVSRIKSFPYSEEKDCGEIKYIVFEMPDEERIRTYLRGSTPGSSPLLDYNFAVAKIDEGQCRITYLLSYEYDNSQVKEVTANFLIEYLQS